jgi:hypothetical protein
MVKCAGVLLEPREFSRDFLYILVYSIPIDTIEVLLREWVENAATIIRNNRGTVDGHIKLGHLKFNLCKSDY